MAGGKKRYIDIVHTSLLAEWQNVFGASAGHSRLEQTRGALRKNDLFMGSDVVAVRMRYKSKALWLPGIQVVRRKIDSALVPDFDH